MRKYTILMLAVLMLLAVAAPATARPPNCDDPSSQHPSCGGGGDEPALAGTTCVEFAGEGYLIDAVSTDFDFGFTPAAAMDDACIDVSKVDANGAWKIDFKVTAGSLRELIVSVRDSAAPGDGCDEARVRPSEAMGTIFLSPNAADTINACGTEYGEMVNGEYFGQATDGKSPLAFIVWTRGSKDLEVNFTVDYPNATP